MELKRSHPMQVVLWPLEKIKPYSRNARKIPQEAVDKVAASIREYGWRQPIVVDRHGVIICGHTRLLASQKLGLRDAPVHVAENLTPAQVRAYRLLDNRSHEETSWDEDLLGLELLDLKGMGVDLDLTGFNLDEIDELLARADGTVGLTDPDAVPEVPETPVSMPGDNDLHPTMKPVELITRAIGNSSKSRNRNRSSIRGYGGYPVAGFHRTRSRTGRRRAGFSFGLESARARPEMN
jgi:hypothetical protein